MRSTTRPIPDLGTLSLQVGEVAEQLGISERGAYRLIESGDLPSFKVRGGRRVLYLDLAAYVQRQRGSGR